MFGHGGCETSTCCSALCVIDTDGGLGVHTVEAVVVAMLVRFTIQ